jgi:Flp pilus assembly protein TadB
LDPPELDGCPGAIMATDPTPGSKPPAANGPPAMTPYAIAVALFAAFVVGGVLGKVVPLWVVVVVGLAVGAAVFVFVDRYPRLPGRG